MNELNINAITKEKIGIYSYGQSLKKIPKKVDYGLFVYVVYLGGRRKEFVCQILRMMVDNRDILWIRS